MSKSEKPRVLRGNARELSMRKIHLTVTQIILSVSKASIIDIFSVWFNTTKFLIFLLFFLPCCSCPVSQLWNISLYRSVSCGPPKSITSISSFNALNSVCFYTSQSWPGIPGSLSHIPIRLSAHHAFKTYLFNAQWPSVSRLKCQFMVHTCATYQPQLVIYSFTLSPWLPGHHYLDFQTLLIASFQFSFLVPPLNIGCPGEQSSDLLSSLTTLTYLFLKWSYPSLVALNGICRLITLNFIQNADLYFQLPIKCLYLRDE